MSKATYCKKRMRSYQDYYIYECKEHDVCVEAGYIEEEILKHAKTFFIVYWMKILMNYMKEVHIKTYERLKAYWKPGDGY